LLQDPPLTTFADFWPHYLRAHSRPWTIRIHMIGTVAALGLVVYAVAARQFWLIGGALLIGYGPAWCSHALVQGNRPTTFRHPLWSFTADFRLLFLWVRGRLAAERAKYGIE